MKVLTPAYGRDYPSADAAIAAYRQGLDWILNDPSSRWNGQPCSCRDFPGEWVELRYWALTRATTSTDSKE